MIVSTMFRCNLQVCLLPVRAVRLVNESRYHRENGQVIKQEKKAFVLENTLSSLAATMEKILL